MFIEKSVKPPRRWKNIGVAICLLLLMSGVLQVVRAQESTTSSQDTQVRRKSELHTRADGKLIAEGKNTNVSQRDPVVRYTVEELKLKEPIEAEIRGKKTEVYQAYRITLFGGPFDVRDIPVFLAIDDKITLIGQEAPKLDKVTFILYDGSLLRDGATLYVSGIELSDKLKLHEPLSTP
jgi:hypothetical protein